MVYPQMRKWTARVAFEALAVFRIMRVMSSMLSLRVEFFLFHDFLFLGVTVGFRASSLNLSQI